MHSSVKWSVAPPLAPPAPLPDQPAQWDIPAHWVGALIVAYGGGYGLWCLGCWLVGLVRHVLS